MSEGTRIEDSLPDRSLTLPEAEALVDSGGGSSVLPSAVLRGDSGDNDVVSLLVETPETVYALGFDPEHEVWTAFETWEGSDDFDRGITAGTVREWVMDHHEVAGSDDVWNPSA